MTCSTSRGQRVEGSGSSDAGQAQGRVRLQIRRPGLGKGGTGTITVDGVEAGSGTFPHTIPFALEASETFDVGSDTGTGVNDADYQTPFAFDGKLNSSDDQASARGLRTNACGEAQWNRSVLGIAAAVEAVTGLFLLVFPHLVAKLPARSSGHGHQHS